jgi:hypothetical protein
MVERGVVKRVAVIAVKTAVVALSKDLVLLITPLLIKRL